MKRSELNRALKELETSCVREHCYLPPFCHFTPAEWQDIGHEYDEVRDCMLGWDITDYGLGDFDRVGMSLITIRNGSRAMADKYPKVYIRRRRKAGHEAKPCYGKAEKRNDTDRAGLEYLKNECGRNENGREENRHGGKRPADF